MSEYQKFYEASQQLLVLHDVLEDEIGQQMQDLLRLLAETQPEKIAITRAYTNLFRQLVEEAVLYPGDSVGNAWQNHLLDRLLDTNSVLARRVRPPVLSYPIEANAYELDPLQAQVLLDNGLSQATRFDLTRLQQLYSLSGVTLTSRVREIVDSRDLPAWNAFRGVGKRSNEDQLRYAFKRELAESKDWPGLLNKLIVFYAQSDPNPFARFEALKWVRQVRGGVFEPVPLVDDQRFENLIGSEREREVVIANTAQFVAGLSANHVLLYGARGTGKSSTVKALLPRFGKQGLRLIEVHKNDLADYPLIAKAIRERPEKFILFVDDLSFEADEFSYKDLKALMEGSLEQRPPNLLIYATSNRRHLIKEQFSDNARPGDEDVNVWDSVEEKLSLSDRFGLIVTFLSPNQTQYLAIVDGLAAQAGITLEQEDLHRRALRWELSHSGRSGRTARQFINQLVGELGLQKLG